VDARRVGRIAIGLILATLAVLVVVFTLVGVHKNQQADRLHSNGVPVTFTFTSCRGLLGGSGSNFTGYVCHGTYGLDGHTYREQLPGNDFHRAGSTVPAVAVPGDSALVSPASMVATEHSSAGVFVVPVVLLLVLLVLVGLLLVRRRSKGGARLEDSGTSPG
jgi:MYXO-CTERM domain-containing protein